MVDGDKVFKALKVGKATGLGCTLTSAECGFLIGHNGALAQYINHLENPEPVPLRGETMSYWRVEYDDGWWTFYKDGIEIKLDNLNFGDLIVDEINNANQRIAELEEKLTIKTLENLKGASVLTDLKARIAELEEERRWIPVSERLPECEKDVIVFWGKASDGSTLDWFGTAWRNECDDGKWCTDPVVPTHWMPLPEPPEVNNE